MILPGSPSHWPISNRKVPLICLKLNSSAKRKKTTTETKILKTCHFGGRNDGIWPKNDEPLTESYLLTHLQSESCTNLCELEFWRKKTSRAPKWKLKKKCHFEGRNDGIWPKNDEPPSESYLLTHFQSKSCTNVSETEFWNNNKRAPKRKFLKNAISETETIEFSWETKILLGSPC